MGLDPTNPMGRVMVSILAFEAIVFGLAIAGMIQVSTWSVTTAFAIGLGAAALAVLAAALLRRPVGYPLGWLTQVVAIAMGFATEMMFAVGGMFALLWVVCFILGRRIEKAHRASV
ncbi:MAG TPA: DUF4233 domain-containing protein [Propionicimonas sp.]|nr:DUF4233 domain-containing protein [Propionicimonas sp.]HRA05555.1 DUF4233 domain-containing protein [Propionicimonas sp.]